MALNTVSIVSWNINGIRATKTPLKTILDAFQSDIICLQETKTTRDLIDETLANVDGYNSYFSFSRKRSGYSGVATYCRNCAVPEAAEEGLTGLLTSESSKEVIGHYGESDDEFTTSYLQSLDSEGRAVITRHVIRTDMEEKAYLTVINVYCPRADPEKPERLEFKLHFYKVLQVRAEAILASGSSVLIVGDININHKPIDHCDPCDEEVFSSAPSRVFMDQFLASTGETENDFIGGKFVDSFRYFHPKRTEAFTCWRTDTGARQTNYGTRLDYIFCDRDLLKQSVMIDSEILSEVSGSDHCPVKCVLKCAIISAKKCPSLCTKFWPEFAGRQTKLVSFLSSKKDLNVNYNKLREEKCEDALEQGHDASHLAKKRKLSTDSSKAVKKQTSKQKTVIDFFKSVTASVKTEPEMEKCDRNVSFDKNSKPINAWKELLKGPRPTPLCKGHNEPSVLRTVKKPGPNLGRDFYVCARPEGHSSNPNSSCNFFKWVSDTKKQ